MVLSEKKENITTTSEIIITNFPIVIFKSEDISEAVVWSTKVYFMVFFLKLPKTWPSLGPVS